MFYFVRGFSPWRPDADIGTTARAPALLASLEFSRSTLHALDVPKVGTLFRRLRLPGPSPPGAIRDPSAPVKKRRKLSPGCRLASSRSRRRREPRVRCGNVDPLPFRCREQTRSNAEKRSFTPAPRRPTAPFSKLIYNLGSINPRPTAVLVEPFSTSTLRRSSLVFATTTKICTKERFDSGSLQELLRDLHVRLLLETSRRSFRDRLAPRATLRERV